MTNIFKVVLNLANSDKKLEISVNFINAKDKENITEAEVIE